MADPAAQPLSETPAPRRLASFLAAVVLGFALVIVCGAIAYKVGLRPEPGTRMWEWTNAFATGANIYGLPQYGFADAYPTATTDDADRDLQALKSMGATTIRVIAAYKGISNKEASHRLDLLLTRAARFHLSVIVSLTNFYGDSGLYPTSMERYFTKSWRGIPYLNAEFFAGGYRDAYLPFVRTVVLANRGHSNIYAWEAGNELQNGDPESFVAFMRDVTHTIKSLDPQHSVADGMIEAHQSGFEPQALYSRLPALDIITVHPGNGYRASAMDVDWALKHGKKAIVEEIGFSGSANRVGLFKREFQFWRLKGVSAVLLDGFIAKGLPDTGGGEKELGFDSIWHSDYDGLAAMVQSMSVQPPLVGVLQQTP